MQCANLIVHESNKRGHHNGDAKPRTLAGDGGNLVAQAFAATGGHENQSILSASDMLNDVLLRPSERLVAKDLAEDTQDVG
jgi:hypothetical protein